MYEVVGDSTELLTDLAGEMDTNVVVIAQTINAQSVGCAELWVAKHLLLHGFGVVVGTDRCVKSDFRDGDSVGLEVEDCASA